jgi:hypothetical protein
MAIFRGVGGSGDATGDAANASVIASNAASDAQDSAIAAAASAASIAPLATALSSGHMQVGGLGNFTRPQVYVGGPYNFEGAYLGSAVHNGGGSLELVAHLGSAVSNAWKIETNFDVYADLLVFSYSGAYTSYGALTYAPLLTISPSGNFRKKANGHFSTSMLGSVVKTANTHDGVGIFPSVFGNKAAMGTLYVHETGTNKYFIASVYKQNESTDVTVTINASNGLSVSATNNSGTVAITGHTTSANVRMRAEIFEIQE